MHAALLTASTVTVLFGALDFALTDLEAGFYYCKVRVLEAGMVQW